MNAGKFVMMYCDVKVNVIMMLFVTCCFAYVIEKYDINKDREHEKLYSIHFSGREGCHIALCLKKICEKNKMANLYQEIRYPLGEASDCMVIVSVFQSRVKLHIRQFYRDYYGKL